MIPKKTALCFLISLAFVACAHTKAERNVDQKIQNDSAPPANSAELSQKAADIIITSPDINEDQRSRLMDLHDKTSSTLVHLREQSLKLRDILITDITTPNFSESEMRVIKKRLKDIEDQRLTVIFDAIDKADVILGRKLAQDAMILKAFDDIPIRQR